MFGSDYLLSQGSHCLTLEKILEMLELQLVLQVGSGLPFGIRNDLIIHSYVKGKGKQGWSSVLAFNKKPSVDLNKNGELRIFFQQRKYQFISNIDLNKWYNITIQQKPNDEKVGEIFKKNHFKSKIILGFFNCYN